MRALARAMRATERQWTMNAKARAFAEVVVERTYATPSGKPYAVLGRAPRERAPKVFRTQAEYEAHERQKRANEEKKRLTFGKVARALFGLGLMVWGARGFTRATEGENVEVKHAKETIENWSGTKTVECEKFFTPENEEEVKKAVQTTHVGKIRAVGSALSPNGCAFEAKGMISLAMLDKVLEVDVEKKRVRVQAGARVREVVESLRPFGLTLQNYASIREQQLGGFTQVGAHGTGARIPPVDETVVQMRIITSRPGTDALTLNAESEPGLFKLAKCGIGALGVVTELTIQCVDAHKLVEYTWTATPSEVESNHEKWLRQYRHIRYMWIPHTDTVVVVASNPLQPGEMEPLIRPGMAEKRRIEPLVRLLREVAPDVDPANMNFGQLRDELLKVNPLDVAHVKRVNAAEAEFWKRSSGMRIDWSDQILGFECGGQQHVLEVAFPVGDLENERPADAPLRSDLQFMRELREMIVKNDIPAHAPIEQRWTSGSSSSMSPAAGAPNSLHSWVGIIMYLPTDNAAEREAITNAFKAYGDKEFDELADKYDLRTHWAKIELERDPSRLEKQRERIRRHYPVDDFNAARKVVDPFSTFANALIKGLFNKS